MVCVCSVPYYFQQGCRHPLVWYAVTKRFTATEDDTRQIIDVKLGVAMIMLETDVGDARLHPPSVQLWCEVLRINPAQHDAGQMIFRNR